MYWKEIISVISGIVFYICSLITLDWILKTEPQKEYIWYALGILLTPFVTLYVYNLLLSMFGINVVDKYICKNCHVSFMRNVFQKCPKCSSVLYKPEQAAKISFIFILIYNLAADTIAIVFPTTSLSVDIPIYVNWIIAVPCFSIAMFRYFVLRQISQRADRYEKSK
jgi:uncharacterized oligopeptide transporter (OPT) family protein